MQNRRVKRQDNLIEALWKVNTCSCLGRHQLNLSPVRLKAVSIRRAFSQTIPFVALVPQRLGHFAGRFLVR